jgi:monofunctional biosynthetic peptidoglycan transglycosylase
MASAGDCRNPVKDPRPLARRPKAKPKRPRTLLRRLVRILILAILVFGFIGPVAVVILYRYVPPPMTFLMVQRLFEGRGFDRRWVSLHDISPRLVGAVIASEDSGFCEHHGFDFDAMKKAMAANEANPRKLRGGSTISQQTAKNIFLWPHRDYVRKGLEAYFTVLIEAVWGKPRIMEVYLNSIEWGPGVYGAEAAAQRNFGVPAKRLNAAQAARLAVIVPKPLAWKADRPGRYVRRRSGTIVRRAGVVRRQGLADCVYAGR